MHYVKTSSVVFSCN